MMGIPTQALHHRSGMHPTHVAGCYCQQRCQRPHAHASCKQTNKIIASLVLQPWQQPAAPGSGGKEWPHHNTWCKGMHRSMIMSQPCKAATSSHAQPTGTRMPERRSTCWLRLALALGCSQPCPQPLPAMPAAYGPSLPHAAVPQWAANCTACAGQVLTFIKPGAVHKAPAAPAVNIIDSHRACW
jgi:hypothetical protein